MPSETMDFKSLSSSLYSFEDICSSTKKQDGFWHSDNLSNCYDSDQGTRPNLSIQMVSNFPENSKVDVITTQHESSLFSSSLSELFSRKLRLSANNALYGHSVDTVASQYEEEMLVDSLEELEAQTIGNLLPNDDDDLLAGLTDGHDHIIQDSASDDLDELDLFTSVGGMDLGDDDSSSSGRKNSEFLGGACNGQLQLCNASTAGEYPYGEHSSRTIFGKNIAGDVEDSELEQKEYSRYLHENDPPLKSPTSFPGLHGVIKSGSMDGKRILGAEPAMHARSQEASFLHRVSSTVPNILPSRLIKSAGNQCGITESSSPRDLNFGIQAASAFDPHSLPEYHDGLVNGVHCNPPELAAIINRETQERIDNMQFCPVNSNGHAMDFNECVFKSSGNGGCPLPGHHHKWSNPYQTVGMKWPNSPSYFDGICAAPALPRLHSVPRSPSHMMSTVLSINNQQHVPSASAVNCNIWDRQHIYAGESHCMDFSSHNIFPHFGGNYVDLQVLPKNVELQFHSPRGMMFPGRHHMIPMINSFGTHKERARSRRNEGGSNLVDMKQYELDIDRIKKGEDNRTTIMIKNIPNKYTAKMLLAAIDERHKGTYDFVYLPIDFKNKCNVGYAFINMTDPGLIIPFYQVFNGKKWEKFNSEKVASLAYARIQGKAALIAHFQNSSLMNEDKRCRPILFNTDGPNAGDQVPFPVGVNVRNKPGRARNNTLEDKLAGRPP